MNKTIYSLIVPIYNEEENIEEFYKRATAVFKALNEKYEIIFVDDGSRDRSREMLKALSQKDPNVKAVLLSRNFGKEIAMTAAIDASRGQAVIPIDADLQDPPEIIPRLVEKWREGWDVVYATRSQRHGESWIKRFTASMFYKVINKFSRIYIPHNTGDFRLMDRRAVKALIKLKENHRFMKGLFAWVGFKQTGIFYERDPRYAGDTKWNYLRLFNFAVEGITSFSSIPLKMASVMGFLISFATFVFAIFILIKTIFFGNPVAGWPSMTLIILFLGGIQLLTIGIIGEYIGRIYDETKQRSLYIVEESLGFQEKKENE